MFIIYGWCNTHGARAKRREIISSREEVYERFCGIEGARIKPKEVECAKGMDETQVLCQVITARILLRLK